MSSEFNKDIYDKLKAPLEQGKTDLTLKKSEENEKRFDEDYLFARNKLKNLVKTGEDAITELLNITMETKEPQAFKVLGELIKVVGELNNSISSNAKTKSDIDNNTGISGKNSPKEVTNNAIFVGNSSDIIDIIKKQTQSIIQPESEKVEEIIENG